MITAVSLNSSIDKLYIVDELKDYTVMRVKENQAFAGGKGINVSKNLNLLGAEMVLTGFLGGYTGKFILQKLDEMNIKSEFCFFDGNTRNCINILEEKTGKHTELLEGGDVLSQGDEEAFVEIFNKLITRSTVVTLSGSVPKGLSSNIYNKLIQICKEKNVAVILDSSGDALKEGLKAKPTVIKPNINEIEDILGKSLHDEKDLICAIEEIRKTGIKYVYVTTGGDGGFLACEEGVYKFFPPKINVANTVGCGDSFVAAVAYSLDRGLSIEKTIKYAVATSAANAMNIKTGFFDKEDFEYCYKNVFIQKIKG